MNRCAKNTRKCPNTPPPARRELSSGHFGVSLCLVSLPTMPPLSLQPLMPTEYPLSTSGLTIWRFVSVVYALHSRQVRGLGSDGRSVDRRSRQLTGMAAVSVTYSDQEMLRHTSLTVQTPPLLYSCNPGNHHSGLCISSPDRSGGSEDQSRVSSERGAAGYTGLSGYWSSRCWDTWGCNLPGTGDQ